MHQLQIQSIEDLDKLIVSFYLWYKSSLEVRGQLDQWFMIDLEVTLDHLNSSIPPGELIYPDTCICGKLFSNTGSRLRHWCIECNGKLGQWMPPIQAEYWILEYCMSKAISLQSHRSHRSDCND